MPGVFYKGTVAVGNGPHGSVDLALHEIGHAYDFASGHSSRSDAFAAAHAAAIDSLEGTSSYYVQPGAAGPREAFAESFAAYFSGNAGFARQNPSLHSYWERDRRFMQGRAEATQPWRR